MQLSQHGCPTLPRRPRLRWYAAAGGSLALLLGLFVAVSTIWAVWRRPRIVDAVVAVSPWIQISLGLSLLGLVIGSVVWAMRTWNLPT
jgi:hypothetical protein